MAQVTLYMNEELRGRVEDAARRADMSVSRWVVRAVTESLDRHWPEGYFEAFGALEPEDLERPGPLDTSRDLPRESID